jgi:hypothetical protein
MSALMSRRLRFPLADGVLTRHEYHGPLPPV